MTCILRVVYEFSIIGEAKVEKKNMRIRGFELVSSFTNENLLPKRETAHAAGYDLKVAERTVIAPKEIKLVPTGVKAYMQAGEVLYLYDRSSNPRKKGLVLINSVGVIDGDYYGNPGNEGHIFAQMQNITEQEVVLEEEDRIVQAVFSPFLLTDNDEADGVRTGGFGSTGIKKEESIIAKKKATFVCQNCEYHSSKYLGRCPNCGAWSLLSKRLKLQRLRMRVFL